jgi:cytochrome c peroxidase
MFRSFAGRSTTPRTRGARLSLGLLASGIWIAACSDEPVVPLVEELEDDSGLALDQELQLQLFLMGIDGRIEERFTAMLGRDIDQNLAEIGRLLFFDPILSITQDNSCSGCHGPNVSFNDSKSISIGIQNNGVVGPDRDGPFNLRRAQTIINAAFYPNLMWDGRFAAESLDGFDNSQGFRLPEPEGYSLSDLDHLLMAQAFTPVTDKIEMAGFDFQGDSDAIRAEITSRVDEIAEYRTRFATSFPEIADGAPLRYEHIARAIAEFEFTLIRADAPLDQYARGDTAAMTPPEKRGALLFFRNPAACFECHITLGYANQMFSDFESHAIGVPQIAPSKTNAVFDGPGYDEDFGRERSTGDISDRYKFRSTPLRNVAYQPTFMHNGAFICLDNSIRHHLEMRESLESFSGEHLEYRLRAKRGPDQDMIQLAHELARNPRGRLTLDQFEDLLAFVEISLSDPEAHPDALRHLIPATVPSGLPVHDFDYDVPPRECR